MRFSVLRENGRNLARGCAVLMVAGAAAGCSSQVARFSDGIDLTSTASTDNQRAIIRKQPVSQPFPGDTIAAAPVDGSYTQSVSRSSIEPIKVQSLPPVAQSEPAAKPVASAPARPKLDGTATGTVRPAAEKPFRQAAPEAPRAVASEDADPKGWSRAGGTQITIREGETVYNLSRRYGVPADVIMKTNGLATADGLQAGQKVVIPTYVYSRKAPVSAPDHNPKVADARSSRGVKSDAPAQKLPLPAQAPADKVAVLPQQPKLKEQKTAAVVDAAAASDPKLKSAREARVAAAQTGAYTVQQGDTLSGISRKTGVSVAALKQANGMKDGLIRIGQTLKLPNGTETTVAGATPAAKAKPAALDPVKTASTPPPAKATASETLASYTPPVKKDDHVIKQAEDDDVQAPDSTGIGKMRWPVRGRVISAYGSGKDGDGIDIAVPEGTPIKAAENGVVIYAGNGLKEFGNTVLVRHEDGLVTVYGHASSLEVQRGQKVKRGQEIAQSGMSGSADSPRLHFEVRKNSAPVDPRTFLE
jgi:murein DD-endopeptidase MepM/ murein hydrolase activator NlpD